MLDNLSCSSISVSFLTNTIMGFTHIVILKFGICKSMTGRRKSLIFFYIKIGIVTAVITSCTVHINFRKLDNIDQFSESRQRSDAQKSVISFFSIKYIYFKVISGSYGTVVVKLNNNGGDKLVETADEYTLP